MFQFQHFYSLNSRCDQINQSLYGHDTSLKWLKVNSSTFSARCSRRKLPLCANRKRKKLFDNLPGLWTTTHSPCVWTVPDEGTDYSFSALHVCVCVCACVCVLCINRTCGSTYHGPFIWGISLPAFARHTLVGSSRGWVPRPSHLCVHVCVCVCVSLGLNIFDISKNPSRIWTSNIVRPDLGPPAFTVEQVSNTCFKASLCCCSHWRAWVGFPLHMVQPYGSSQTHSTINTHWNIPSATDMTNTRNLAIKMREYWTWFCISLYSQYCLVTCSI